MPAFVEESGLPSPPPLLFNHPALQLFCVSVCACVCSLVACVDMRLPLDSVSELLVRVTSKPWDIHTQSDSASAGSTGPAPSVAGMSAAISAARSVFGSATDLEKGLGSLTADKKAATLLQVQRVLDDLQQRLVSAGDDWSKVVVEVSCAAEQRCQQPWVAFGWPALCQRQALCRCELF